MSMADPARVSVCLPIGKGISVLFSVAIIMLLPLFVAANGDDRIVLQMQVVCTASTNVAIPIPSRCTR